jgi:hypothetical protein
MRKPHVIESKGIALMLNANELADIIDSVTAAADHAESSAYVVAGTLDAKQLARDRAKRLYALAARLLDIQ